MGFRNSDKALLVRIEYIILMLTVATFIVAHSCSPGVPKGQVKGLLVDEEGVPLPPKQVDVFLATILGDEMELNTSWQSPLDDSGEFLIEEVPPGRYCLVLFFKNNAVFGLLLKEDERFEFELPQDIGIDLGKVNASQFRNL